MPRSAPGPMTSWPSRRTSPVVGASSPATMRSSVLLPQPDGPRIVMKSLSAIDKVVGSSASTGAPLRAPANVRATPSIASALRPVSSRRARLRVAPRKQRTVRALEPEVGNEPDDSDQDDAEDDLAGIEQRLAVGDHVANAARRADEFRDDHVGPRPAEDQAQRLGDGGCGARQQHAAH